jgi:hypothetical protein
MTTLTILSTAVSSTTVYKSRVVQQGRMRAYLAFKLTSTATGKLRSYINNLPEAAYQAAVAAASGSTWADKEIANDTGWELEPFSASDIPTGRTVATGGEIDVDGAGVASVNANLPPGPMRRRLTYQNATNSGAASITRRYV